MDHWRVYVVSKRQRQKPIRSPYAQNALNALLLRNVSGEATGTFANRVPGVPLFTEDLNYHCFDPNKSFVLNPAAWADPPAGQFGTSAAFYSDYRYQRRPIENLAVGRTFRVTERVSFNIRAEFTNVLNRTRLQDPVSTNALAPQTVNSAKQTTAGFGWISTAVGSTPATSIQMPRSGTIVGRFTF